MSILTADIRRSLHGNSTNDFYENSQISGFISQTNQQSSNLDSLSQIRADLRKKINLFH